MFRSRQSRLMLAASLVLVMFLSACAGSAYRGPYTTNRDKTAKGAGVGAAVGVAAALAKGKREADELLAGAAIGALAGAGVGAYMDAQEEKIARIPGTSVERVGPATLLVKLDSDVLFAVDSALLAPQAQTPVYQMADVMMEFPKTAVVVHGHTDSTGGEEHNQSLSERRAKSVANLMISRGVDSARISSIGSGESLPIADNESDWGRQQNRRVEIVIKAKAK